MEKRFSNSCLHLNVGRMKELVIENRNISDVFAPAKSNDEPIEVDCSFKCLVCLAIRYILVASPITLQTRLISFLAAKEIGNFLEILPMAYMSLIERVF